MRVRARGDVYKRQRWCLETATQYAKDRRQFGRPIGQFQAVKHRLADMLVSVEQVTALAWDVARATDSAGADQAGLSAVLAGALALDAYVEAAKGCVQILGGMGFTWEHDAHIHLLSLIHIFTETVWKDASTGEPVVSSKFNLIHRG